MYGYVYKTTNTVDGKIYVGRHKPRKQDTVDYSYFGSGIHIRNALQAYGKKNFKTEILEWCDTPDGLNDREKFWIANLDARNPDKGYNLSEGGQGVDSVFLSHPGKLNGMYGVHRFGEDNPNYGKRHTFSEEIRKRMSQADRKPRGPLSEETKRKMSEAWSYEKHITPEFRAKISKAIKGRKHTDETKLKMSQNNGMHNEEYRKKVSAALKGRPSPCKGTIWINNNGKTKMIQKDMLDEYINNGWKLGRQ